jgi:hypothetical protein
MSKVVSLSVAHINKEKKENPVKELSKILGEKWTRKNREKAEKMYGKIKR